MTCCSGIHFLGGEELPGAEGEDEDVVRLQDEGRGDEEPPLADEANESGEMAVRAEALVERRFGSSGPNEALRRLAREAPTRLPRRRGHRRMRARRGPWADLRRTLRESARNDGEVMRLGAAEAARAAAQDAAADRCLGLDEVALRGQSQARACAGAGDARASKSSPSARA